MDRMDNFFKMDGGQDGWTGGETRIDPDRFQKMLTRLSKIKQRMFMFAFLEWPGV